MQVHDTPAVTVASVGHAIKQGVSPAVLARFLVLGMPGGVMMAADAASFDVTTVMASVLGALATALLPNVLGRPDRLASVCFMSERRVILTSCTCLQLPVLLFGLVVHQFRPPPCPLGDFFGLVVHQLRPAPCPLWGLCQHPSLEWTNGCSSVCMSPDLVIHPRVWLVRTSSVAKHNSLRLC